ncbi:sulfite exporter TauE/SafE family protein [Nakamurella antarctica]|uniref:Probable membrane transporter protein n=1 Tax=Nakamurella antarctica TaxID=1902245 RepID=A0A3G8ZNH7_9ACTN|nr:sulfite exporter TauE/SafE family protein [Nakamurella antarctica]AZI58810.1 sulfite exporter TauE/SafE family protein [Nakamurella antarctica]
MIVAAAIGLGLLIGAFLGALGGGGAILTVPALIYLLGQTAQEATTGSLVIVGAASITGMSGYARSHHVMWRLGVLFGIAGIGAAVAGTALNAQVDQRWLLLSFAVVMVLAAVAMLIRARNDAAAKTALATTKVPTPAGGPGPAPFVTSWDLTTGVRVLLAGLGVGFLTGFFGVGGGFVIVPVLVLIFGLSMATAAGTSLLIVTLNSTASLIARAGHVHVEWHVIIPFAVAAMVASLAGKAIASKLPDVSLTRAFAGMLIAIAAFVASENIIALAS